MKILSAAVLSGLALALAVPASATAILTISPNPTHLPNRIIDDAVPDGSTLRLPDELGNRYDFIANDGTILAHSGNGGFAGVTAVNGLGFSSLTIDPFTTTGFTEINFELGGLGQGNNTYYADFILDLFGGGQEIFQNVAVSTGGTNHFGISSDNNQLFTAITFTNYFTTQANTAGNEARFEGIRQVSIDPANAVNSPVPEPATWLMMIFGFGAVGAMLRRPRRAGMRFSPAL